MTGRDRRAERTGSRRLPRGAPPQESRPRRVTGAGCEALRTAGGLLPRWPSRRARDRLPGPVAGAACRWQERRASGLGGLWLLPVPVSCCGGPLVAAAGILATGGLWIALAAVLAGVLLATGCAGGAAPGAARARSPEGARLPSRGFLRAGQERSAVSCRHRHPARLWLAVAQGDVDDSPADRICDRHRERGCGRLLLQQPGGGRWTSSMWSSSAWERAVRRLRAGCSMRAGGSRWSNAS